MMKIIRKPGICIVITLLVCFNNEAKAQYNEVIKSISSTCYAAGYYPERAIDNNTSTSYMVHPYVSCSDKNVNLQIVLRRNIKAASMRIISDAPGIIVSIGDVENYHTTLESDEVVYLLKPNEFDTINLYREGPGNVHEITIEEISISTVNMPYSYDNSGRMYHRSFFMGTLKNSGLVDNTPVLMDNPDQDLFHETIAGIGIRIYPNPTRENVKVEFNGLDLENDKGTITLFSINGVAIREYKTDDFYTLVELNNLSSGLYFIKVNLADETKMWKIVKE